MWIIKRIEEADFGCEERMPGEPLMVLVTFECDDGRIMQLEVADSWLITQELNEGDEWPQDLDSSENELDEKCDRQSLFMDNYLDAVSELDE